MEHLVAYELGAIRKYIKDISNQGGTLRDLIVHAPGLLAYWPMSARTIDGDLIDLLSVNSYIADTGTPPVGLGGVAMSYCEFDGSSQYFSGSLPALDVAGDEAHISSSLNGITVGGWVNLDTVAAAQTIISRWGAAGNRAFNLFINTSGDWRFSVSEDGTATSAISGTAGQAGAWKFIAGRFSTNSEVAVFVNSAKTTTPSSLASIYPSTASLRIGADNNTTPQYFNGKISDVFLCAAALPDEYIYAMFQAGRSRAGV